MEHRFAMQLFSPLSWDFVPDTRLDRSGPCPCTNQFHSLIVPLPHALPSFEGEDYEHFTDCKVVNMNSESVLSGKKGYIAIGTTRVFGEEVTCRGRVGKGRRGGG